MTHNNNTLVLAEPFLSLWAGQDAFAEVEQLRGQIFRDMPGRRTLRVEVDGRGYFVKIHRGVGWGEILKNLCTLKWPVLGAGQEWRALERLHQAGVPTMRAVAFGERGQNPATRHSFIVTEEIAPAVDLETLTRHWREAPPAPGQKHALIAAVAHSVGRMHRAGVNHRDCYLCHFLLRQTEDKNTAPNLAMIDLHRAQTRAATPRRWRNKDLAALYFSALDIGLTRRDILRFLRDYFVDCPLRDIFRTEASLLLWLKKDAERLARRFVRLQATGRPL
ncbi:MAG: lipopolysaccharide core heptose(I) kinase RfaP [Zoogloeaceae bacterium]|jgi:heptose I phosphotransferase|nr:lipopolysaccharide core heptose(I) kinase RfaP [Zoogloeaceae bacterium]